MIDQVTSTSSFGLSENGIRNILLPEINREEIQLQEELGCGASGIVYKGKCRQATVAVKRLHALGNDDEHNKFWGEVAIMLQIRHPNVLNIMGACTDPENCLIVTEFLPNKDLQHLLDKSAESKKPISMMYALKLGQDIASGMNWLHCSQPQIIHRDLKPANILIDQYNNAKIADFGLSVINQERAKQEKKLAGSPLWMAPEILELKPVNEKIDIYSFGIIFYQLLTTSPIPYDLTQYKDDVKKFMFEIVTKKKRPVLPASLPSQIVSLLEETWEYNPPKRPGFDKIINSLGTISCSITLGSDIDAINMWSQFSKQNAVKLLKFGSMVYGELGLQIPYNDAKLEDKQKWHCLMTLARDETIDYQQGKKEKYEKTSLTRFGLILGWFGPFKPGNPNHPTFLEKMYITMREPWFHGDIDRNTAERLMQGKNNPRAWLVRTSDNPTYPFTISRIVQDKFKNLAFSHTRITYDSTENKLILQLEVKTQNKGKSTRIETTTMPELIKLCYGPLNLKTKHIVPRQRYDELFLPPKAPDIASAVGYDKVGVK